MLLILLLTAWLTITILFVALAGMAARGDARHAPADAESRKVEGGLVGWEEPESARPHARRSHGVRRRLTPRGMRTHDVR